MHPGLLPLLAPMTVGTEPMLGLVAAEEALTLLVLLLALVEGWGKKM